jgi:hypothetical protein
MTWKIFLTQSYNLVIEFGDGKACLYSAVNGGLIVHNGPSADWGEPRIAINHYQLMKALKAMAQDAPGDYSNR